MTRPLFPLLIAAIALMTLTGCRDYLQVYHTVERTPDGTLMDEATGLTYVLTTGVEPITWVLRNPHLDADGLRGEFFRIEGPRADVVRSIPNGPWMTRMDGSTMFQADSGWVQPDGNGAQAFLPSTMITGVLRVEKDRRTSTEHALIVTALTAGATILSMEILLSAAPIDLMGGN